MRFPEKKVSFHSPFKLLFLLAKNESTKTSINTISFHGKKSHIENTVGINTCRLFTHLRLFLLLLEDNHLKCVSNVMLKLHNSRNFSFARFLVGLLKYKPGKYTELS